MKMVSFGDICSMNYGIKVTSVKEYLTDQPSGIPFIRIDDVRNNKIVDCKNWVKSGCNKPLKLAQKNDLLLAALATVGVIAWVELDQCIYGNHFIILKVNEQRVNKKYLFYWCIANQSKFRKFANGSVTLNLRIDVLKEIKITLPSLETQKEFVTIVEPFHELIINKDKKIKLDQEVLLKFLKKMIN